LLVGHGIKNQLPDLLFQIVGGAFGHVAYLLAKSGERLRLLVEFGVD
jgi:hypothetical protein